MAKFTKENIIKFIMDIRNPIILLSYGSMLYAAFSGNKNRHLADSSQALVSASCSANSTEIINANLQTISTNEYTESQIEGAMVVGLGILAALPLTNESVKHRTKGGWSESINFYINNWDYIVGRMLEFLFIALLIMGGNENGKKNPQNAIGMGLGAFAALMLGSYLVLRHKGKVEHEESLSGSAIPVSSSSMSPSSSPSAPFGSAGNPHYSRMYGNGGGEGSNSATLSQPGTNQGYVPPSFNSTSQNNI